MGVLAELQVGTPEVDQHHGQEILQTQKWGELERALRAGEETVPGPSSRFWAWSRPRKSRVKWCGGTCKDKGLKWGHSLHQTRGPNALAALRLH